MECKNCKTLNKEGYKFIGWDKDFMPIAEMYGEDLSTSGARINIGVVF